MGSITDTSFELVFRHETGADLQQLLAARGVALQGPRMSTPGRTPADLAPLESMLNANLANPGFPSFALGAIAKPAAAPPVLQ